MSAAMDGNGWKDYDYLLYMYENKQQLINKIVLVSAVGEENHQPRRAFL